MFVKANSLKDIKAYFSTELSTIFSENEINLMVKELTIKRFNINRIEYVQYSETLLSESDLLYYHKALKRLKNNEPFQYILGEVYFYNLVLSVAPGVLIPRPETEELVDWVVNSFQHQLPNKIMDVCAGSGCIALALATHFRDAEVTAVEYSQDALKVLHQNKIRTGVPIDIIEMDVLESAAFTPFSENTFDCWVSNPPYIPERDKALMHANVLDYEPHVALFVADDDALIFYRVIAQQAQCYLNDHGLLFFEVHENLSAEVVSLLEELNFVNIEVRKDLQGKPRMIKAQKLISQA